MPRCIITCILISSKIIIFAVLKLRMVASAVTERTELERTKSESKEVACCLPKSKEVIRVRKYRYGIAWGGDDRQNTRQVRLG
jgi:hypothetical protein